MYIVFIATTFRDVMKDTLDWQYDVRMYIAVVTLACCFMGQIRELKYLVPFSAIANLFIVITFTITLYFLLSGPLKFSERPMFTSFEQLPIFLSTVIFSMEGIGVVMPVENTMKKPSQFLGCPGVLNTAMGVIVSLYAVIGFLGYVRYGDTVHASITMDLPPGLV